MDADHPDSKHSVVRDFRAAKSGGALDDEPTTVNRIERTGMSFRVGMLVVVLALDVTVRTAQFASTGPAEQLAFFFDRTGHAAVASVDPTDSDAFVAALYVAGTLLLVRARHPAVGEMTRLIKERRFVDVYSRIAGSSVETGKLFVRDVSADGLLSATPGAEMIDAARMGGSREVLFNGNVAAQNLTAAQYDRALADADTRYARLLRILLAAAES